MRAIVRGAFAATLLWVTVLATALDSNIPADALPSASTYSESVLAELQGVVSWDTLAQVESAKRGSKIVAQFSKEIVALDGQQVRVQGFIQPMDFGNRHKHFLIMAVHCPFCLPAGPQDIVEVFATEPVAYGFDPVVVTGKLTVLSDDPSGLLYQLTDAEPVEVQRNLGWIVAATLVTGVLSALVAALFAFALARRWVPYLVSFAVGVLLSVAFLDLLPEAAESMPLNSVLAVTLAGILAFFLLEKLALWHHGHARLSNPGARKDIKPAGPMILIGDGLHNFTDGILLAAAFLTDVHLGVVTTLAVVAHEIPREMGDFGVLLDSGFSWRQALFWNVLFSIAAICGGVLGYFALSVARPAIPYAIALAAASFIYIAIADLVPGLHQHVATREAIAQTATIALGVACMAVAVSYLR